MHVKKNIFHNVLDPLLCVTNLPPVQFASAAQAVTDLIARDADVQTAFLLMVPKSRFVQSSKGTFAPNMISCPRGVMFHLVWVFHSLTRVSGRDIGDVGYVISKCT